MLIVARRMYEMNFSQLMEVYYEGNQENGACFFPDETPGRALILAEQQFREYLQEDFFAQKKAAYYIWQEDGHYVSALRLESYRDGLLLEALETKPDCRRRGYAKALIQSVVREFPKGTKIYSHVAKHNTASLETHRSCGFAQLLDYAMELDGTVTRNHMTLQYVCGAQ